MNHRILSHPKLLGIALTAALVALAAPARPDDDDDEREELRILARRSFVENCLMCHGEDMTTRQRLTAKQWTAEVEKMAGWGAPLPPDRKQPLIDYLAETYPNTHAAPPPERITPEEVAGLARPAPPSPLPSAEPARGEALLATHCAACPGPARTGGERCANL